MGILTNEKPNQSVTIKKKIRKNNIDNVEKHQENRSRNENTETKL